MSIGAGLLLSMLISFSTTRPTATVVAVAEQLTQGDFTHSLAMHRKDEIGQLAQSMNHLVANLGKMLREVNNGGTTLNASSSY